MLPPLKLRQVLELLWMIRIQQEWCHASFWAESEKTSRFYFLCLETGSWSLSHHVRIQLFKSTMLETHVGRSWNHMNRKGCPARPQVRSQTSWSIADSPSLCCVWIPVPQNCGKKKNHKIRVPTVAQQKQTRLASWVLRFHPWPGFLG